MANRSGSHQHVLEKLCVLSWASPEKFSYRKSKKLLNTAFTNLDFSKAVKYLIHGLLEIVGSYRQNYPKNLDHALFWSVWTQSLILLRCFESPSDFDAFCSILFWSFCIMIGFLKRTPTSRIIRVYEIQIPTFFCINLNSLEPLMRYVFSFFPCVFLLSFALAFQFCLLFSRTLLSVSHLSDLFYYDKWVYWSLFLRFIYPQLPFSCRIFL